MSQEPQASRAAAPKREFTEIFLVEEFETTAGTVIFGLGLLFFNLVMGAWMFGNQRSALQETEVVLMWIGGNQALGFLLLLTRRRLFRVWKNWRPW